MTGLNVLSSTGLKVAAVSDSSSSPKKGTGSTDDSVAAEFAAILGGWMFPVYVTKGQNSEEKKSGDETQQNPQDTLGIMTVSNDLGVQKLGLQKVLAGLLGLSQAESIIQSDFPAGKEANSGGAVNQGNRIPLELINVLVGNKPLESAMTLQRTGMLPQMSVGGSSSILSELDEYKSIVSELLKELSGEVRVESPSSNEDGLKANGSDLNGTLSKNTLDWLRTKMSLVTETLSEMDQQSFKNTIKQTIGANPTQVQETSIAKGLATRAQETPTIQGLNVEVKSTLTKPPVQVNPVEQFPITPTPTPTSTSTSNREGEKSVVTQVKTNAVDTDEAMLVSPLQNDKLVLVGQNENTSRNQNTSKRPIEVTPTQVQETPITKGLATVAQETPTIQGLNAEVKSTLTKPLVQVNPVEQLKAEKEVLSLPTTSIKRDLDTNSTELNKSSQIIEVNKRNQFAKGVQNQELSQNTTDLSKSVNRIIIEGQQSLAIGADLSKGSFAGNNRDKETSNSPVSSDETVINDEQVVNSKFDLNNLSSLIAKEKTQTMSSMTDSKSDISPVWEQISTAMRRHSIVQHPEVKELEIQLHPADLGKIQLAIRWENGQVHLQCQASETATTSMLQQNLAQLRETLQNSGISCGMLQMGLGGQHQQKPKNEFNVYIQLSEKEAEEKNAQLKGISYSANGQLTDHLINVTA
ncbi:MAG: flagellar hook-length control protein FliK [Desulfitobacteriaceae bacterium]